MRDCPNARLRELLPDLLNERLDDAARRELDEHLATCAPCAAELALLRGVRAALAATPAVDHAAIVAALPAPPARRSARRRSWSRWGGGASLALAAGVGALMMLGDRAGTGAATDRAARVADSVRGVRVAPVPAPGRRAGGSTGASTTAVPARPAASGTRELALAAGLSEVSDGALATLLDDIERLEAVPAAEPDEALPVGTGGAGGTSW